MATMATDIIGGPSTQISIHDSLGRTTMSLLTFLVTGMELQSMGSIHKADLVGEVLIDRDLEFTTEVSNIQ